VVIVGSLERLAAAVALLMSGPCLKAARTTVTHLTQAVIDVPFAQLADSNFKQPDNVIANA
jgi:hypothetical protein